MENDVVICEPVRTPIGMFGGSLKGISSVDLGAHAIAATLRRAGLNPADVDSVIFGNVIQAGSRMNVARQVAVKGGLPVEVPAMTVNRVCGSGAQAVLSAYAEIRAGLAEVIIAGGTENMERAPYLLSAMRAGARMGNAEAVDAMLADGLHDAFSGKHSGWHTEDLVSKYQLTRLDLDQYAARSQSRFAAAQQAGWFNDEIEPVTVPGKRGDAVFEKDESVRPETTVQSLAGLKPVFRPDGKITAGNSPGVNAGAAAMIVCTRAAAQRHGLQALLTIKGAAVAGVEPGMFGLGPVPAIKSALQNAQWHMEEVDRFEINEAFAAIVLAVQTELGISDDRLNVDGGAIAHGHPIGATGAVLITKAAHALKRLGQKRAVVSLCIGGGQGIALCLERDA